MRLDPGLDLPRRAHPDDAGVDLSVRTDVDLAPGARALVGTGIALALPTGYAGFVHPRSGLAARRGLGVLNAPGTVDAGFRGEQPHDAQHGHPPPPRHRQPLPDDRLTLGVVHGG